MTTSGPVTKITKQHIHTPEKCHGACKEEVSKQAFLAGATTGASLMLWKPSDTASTNIAEKRAP